MVLYYLQVNIICLIILGGIRRMSRKVQEDFSEKRIAFGRLLAWTAVLCISDMAASIFRGKTFDGAEHIIHLSNMLYLLCMTWAGYEWMVYSNIRIRGIDFDCRKFKTIAAIPLAVMGLIILTNPLTGWLFTIDENNLYSRQSLLFLHWIISWGYLLVTTVQVFFAIRKADTKAKKSELYPLLYFLVLPAIAGVSQMLFYGVTSTQCGITLSIAMVFFNSMNDKVMKDALTGLNNRSALNGFLGDQFGKNEQYVYAFMMDIDGFKHFNDTYGHSVGDRALQLAALSLKKTCAESASNLFLCRYGGDEFLIIGRNMSDVEADELTEKIRNNEQHCCVGNSRISIGFSVGMASSVCLNAADAEKLLVRADEDMYKNKLLKKE